MATGIIKQKRDSRQVISASDFHQDPIPLPPDNSSVILNYPNKANPSDIIKSTSCQFHKVEDEGTAPIGRIPDNSFILNDNFLVLNTLIEQGTRVDLYYLDPPYGTGFDFHCRNLEPAYSDNMGQAAYIEFMRRRLILMRETMVEDGSIYLHIGHRMVAHLKVVMDEIFGPDNFRNLITRRKCSSKNSTGKQYANVNDYILFYSRSKSWKWNRPGIKPDQDWIDREYPKFDNSGRRYKLVAVHAPGIRNGKTGQPWREKMPPPGKHWQYTPEKLEEMDRRGDIHWSRNGNPRRKVYWSSDRNIALTDYWNQYRDAHHQSIKITGYPTEKNFAMVRMIIEAGSDRGDLVVDPFCGSGTTLHAARDLRRRYLGMDASFSAAKATLHRMRHGPEPMGDYVNKCTGEAEKQHLHSAREQQQQQSACNFITDSRIIDGYYKEIQEIARI